MTSITELKLSPDLLKIVEDEHIESIEELEGLLGGGAPFKAKLSFKQIEAFYDALRKAGVV